MSIHRIKGTNDIFPETLAEDIFRSDLWVWLENLARQVAGNFAYKELRTPVFEPSELFIHGLGDGSDVVQKEMFRFTDRGERDISLRPEGTAAVVRAYLENSVHKKESLSRFFYMGPMFRAERPQKGRYRQFHQFGVECIGAKGAEYDVEVITLFWFLLEKLGLGDMQLKINSVGCDACRPDYLEKLRHYFSDKLEDLCDDCRVRYERNVLRMLDCKNPSCQPVLDQAPPIESALCSVCSDSFHEVQAELKLLQIPFAVDKRMVRGLDYYTRTAFEIIHSLLGSQSTIVGGGRYDALFRMSGGPDIPAVGAAFGIERLLLALQQEKGLSEKADNPELFLVVFDKARNNELLSLLYRLRREGVYAVKSDGSLQIGKQLKAADRARARFALFVGGEEWESGRILVKDLQQKTQTELPKEGDDLLPVIMNWLSRQES